jgi:hypothetical protein
MSNSKTARVSDSSSPSSHASLKRVGTHNGSFHCDEALGCFMIRLTRKFFNAQIVRTRDPQVRIGPFSIYTPFPRLFLKKFYFFIVLLLRKCLFFFVCLVIEKNMIFFVCFDVKM